MTCPSSLVLSQAFPGRASVELQAHLQACSACAAQWSALAQTRTVVQELPYVNPDKGRRDGVRTRLLAAAARQPVGSPSLARWRTWGGIAAAALCVLLGARLISDRTTHDPKSASHRRAVVQSPIAGIFVHERAGGDEWVRLVDGTLHIEVQPLQAGERFRVVCGDSEVEVRGTAFDTVVERDHLRSVSVLHGLVEVRPYGRPAVILGAGQHWQSEEASSRPSADPSAAQSPRVEAAPRAPEPVQAPAISPDSKPAAAASKSPPASVSSDPSSTKRSATVAIRRAAAAASSAAHNAAPAALHPGAGSVAAQAPPASSAKPAISAAELAFMDGWAALRQGRHQAAAESFARAAQQSAGTPGAPLLEDARFWHAVAVARSGQRPAAIAALREFLRQHPAAPRSGEAHAILGWQLLRDAQLDAAQRCFEAAEKDAHAAIRETARSGLAAVAARR